RRYATVYEQGHFNLRPPFGFSTDSSVETPEQRAARLARTAREPGFEFYQACRPPACPRLIAVTFQHPTPSFDDSSAVNSDTNAFVHPVAGWMSYDVPAEQEVTGQPRISVRQESQFEAVLGSRARSGEQFAIWEATYGPVGPDGYPAELWNLATGTIDHAVADYFKAHDYDLR